MRGLSFTSRRLRASTALLLAIGLCLSTQHASAQMGASVSAPLRHDIDSACAPLELAAEHSKLMYANYTTADHPKPTNWMRYGDPAPGEKIRPTSQDDATGTFAHVLARGNTIRAAFFFTPETQTKGETTSWYCYRNDRLARLRTRSILRTAVIWTRTKYYGEDGAYMTQTDTHRSAIAGDDTPPGPAPKDEPVYARPKALPFYSTFQLSHSLKETSR